MPLTLLNINGAGKLSLLNNTNSGSFIMTLSGSVTPSPTPTSTPTFTPTPTSTPTFTPTPTPTNTPTPTPASDQLRAQLTASVAAYDSATTNNWVKITKTEYDKIAANITGATKKGNTDVQVATRASSAGFTEFQFSINNNTGSALTINTGEYPIAFVAETWNTTQTVQFGYDTDYHTGAPTYGNSVTVTPVGACYYVRKAPTGVESAPASQTLYPSLKLNGGSFNLVPNTSGWYTTNGGTTWAALQGGAVNGAAKFQMIVTTTKSW